MTTIAERTAYFKRFIAQAVSLPVLVLVLLAGLLCWQVGSLLSAARWVDHSDQTIAQANKTLKLAVDSETGERGYLVGGNPLFLQPYNEANQTIGKAFDTLCHQVADNPDQLRRARQMQAQYALWHAEADLEMQMEQHDPSGYRAYFDQANGKDLMDGLRTQFEVFIAAAERMREDRDHRVAQQTKNTFVGTGLIAVCAGLVLGVSTVRQTRSLSRQYEEALAATQKSAQLLSTTLLSIGDAVLVTDASGRIVQMNAIAQTLTGWTQAEAYGKPASDVFPIYNETTRERVESPIDRVLREGIIVGLANHTVLVHRSGRDIPIDDSGAPIRDEDGNLFGVVLVFRDITERRQAEAQLSEIYEKEHRIAEVLQNSLLSRPSGDALSRLEVETLYRPAWDEAKVGGDYYDFFPLEDGRVALIVGDISGKGLQAASRVAEVKYVLRAYLSEYSSAADALARLNTYLCDTQSRQHDLNAYFLCAVLAIVDPLCQSAAIYVAGAGPPLIVRNSGVVETVQAGGAPLGVALESVFLPAKVALNAGDIFLAATDGIFEARRGKDFLGAEGFARLAKRARSAGSLEELGNSLLGEIVGFAGGRLTDDVCLLLARPR